MEQGTWTRITAATQEFTEDIVAMAKSYPDQAVRSKVVFGALAPRIPAELHDLAYAIVCYTVLTQAECQTVWDQPPTARLSRNQASCHAGC